MPCAPLAGHRRQDRVRPVRLRLVGWLVERRRAVPFARALAAAPLGSLTVRKWRLENGLEIITVPDPGARSVSYLTVYRVGSRDENAAAGETGLAHLFEHLMFTGTATGQGGRQFR